MINLERTEIQNVINKTLSLGDTGLCVAKHRKV
jgi:hypothetical protein